MFYTKMSHIIIVSLLLFIGNSFGQQTAKKQPEQVIEYYKKLETKPQTIYLKSGKHIKAAFASDNEKQVYLADTEGSIYSFELETCRQNWSAVLGGEITSNIISFKNRLFVTTTVDADVLEKSLTESFLWEIDINSGLTVNKTKVNGKSPFYLYGFQNSVLNVSSNSCVSLIDSLKMTEQVVEIFCTEKDLVAKPVFDQKNLILYLAHKENITRLSIGGQISSQNIESKSETINSFGVSPTGETFFIGDDTGTVFGSTWLNRNKIWRFRAGGKISSIQVFDDNILVSSHDNFVYCLRKNDGEIVWKKRFPGRITEIVSVSGNDSAIRPIYSNEYFIIDVRTGIIKDKYILSNSTEKSALLIGLRLIMIINLNSLDIYKKN